MEINIDTEILEIQILSNNLLKELKAYNKDLKSDKFWCPNKHRASFNRLRLELNNRFVELSKKFKEIK